jgi:hypothetical protein
MDSYIESKLTGERLAGARAAARLMEGRFRAVQEKEFELHQLMASRVTEMLGFPIAEIQRRVEVAKDGTAVQVVEVHPVAFAYRELPAMAKEASRLGRISLGVPTDGAKYGTPPPEGADTSDLDAFIKHMYGEASPDQADEDAPPQDDEGPASE